jgi:prevent-host-death family protein
VNIADAKRIFSDLVSRVAYGGETIVITRRGRPMAKLVPPSAELDAEHVANVRGWLDDDDPYFRILDEVVAARRRHVPRALVRGGGVRRVRKT